VRVVGRGGASTETIVVSRPHPFYVNGHGWVPAANLKARDEIVTGIWDDSPGEAHLNTVAWKGPGPAPAHAGTATVLSVHIELSPLSAHNLTVDGFHTYLVGETGLWVHNSCGGTIGDILDGYHPDSYIHLTPGSAGDFANGVDPLTSFARLGDVAHMTVPDYQLNVVGYLAGAGPDQAVSGFMVAPPGTGTFAVDQVNTYIGNVAGVTEYNNTTRFFGGSYVPLP